MQSEWVICDGELTRATALKISPFDLGWTVGDGIFETLLVTQGRIFAFARHFARLQNSALLLGLAGPKEEGLRSDCERLIEASGLREGRLRITLSAGVPTHGFAREENASRLLITVASLPLGEQKPAVLVLSETRRFSNAISSRAKTLSYGESVWALRAGQKRGADEVLLANERGEVCEGAMANVFWWKEGKWRTPPLASGCLPGVTRALILERLAEKGNEGLEETMPLASLSEVEEVFLCNSIRGVWPVSHLAGRALPLARGQALAEDFAQLLRRDDLL